VNAKGLVTAASNVSYQPLDADLTAIAALTGSSGFLKSNGAGVWSVDTATYLASTGNTSINVVNAGFSSAALTTTTTTALQVVDSLPIATYRSAKYVVQVTSGTAYQVSEILVIHDGTTAYITEYGTMATGAALATFSADVITGNLVLQVTPVNAATVIKASRNTINI
jgi:hypothetical protein